MASDKRNLPLAIICLLALILGSTALWAYQTNDKVTGLEAQIKALKDSNRSAWQKVYDMQEKGNDALEAAEGEASVWKWKFEQCEAKGHEQ